MTDTTTARLLITCPDRPGIVASVAGFFHNHNANITTMQQHSTDPEGGRFFMRLEFQTPHLDMTRHALEEAFGRVVGERFDMDWHMTYTSHPRRTALLVSKYDHALLELLWQWRSKRLPTEITMVISNHETLRKQVEQFDLPFHHVPVTRETKPEAEAKVLELLEGQADLVVLARYMQILSADFVDRYAQRIINIHHSFLPAFVGANPYRQAYERGVKIIGATAHYVTADLDQGPIIAQDVVHVDHRLSVRDLTERGRSVERRVLAQAVKWHLEDRIVIEGGKTIVFE